jgi:hypothetical protein
MDLLSGVWCAANGVCLGVGRTPGDVGAVVVLRANGPVGPVQPVRGTTRLNEIDCTPGGGCIAVGRGPTGGMVVEIAADGSPGPVRPVPGTTELLDVACPTATTCLATGYLWQWPPLAPASTTTRLFVVINNGQPAPAQEMRGRGGGAIDCPSATTCLTFGSSGVVIVTKADGNWTTTVRRFTATFPAGHPTGSLSCPSATTCYATAAAFIQRPDGYLGVPGMVAVSADGVVGPVQTLHDQSGNSFDISCVYVRSCTVVGQGNFPSTGLIIDVFRGTPTLTSWPGHAFFGVSCVGPATCGVVGSSSGSAVFLWHGPVPAVMS